MKNCQTIKIVDLRNSLKHGQTEIGTKTLRELDGFESIHLSPGRGGLKILSGCEPVLERQREHR